MLIAKMSVGKLVVVEHKMKSEDQARAAARLFTHGKVDDRRCDVYDNDGCVFTYKGKKDGHTFENHRV